MKLIAIVGKKRSGKDTIAEIIKQEYSAYSLAFADVLKDALWDAYNLSRVHEEGAPIYKRSDFDTVQGEEDRRSENVLISNKQAAKILISAVEYLQCNYNLDGGIIRSSDFDHKYEITKKVMQNKKTWSIRTLMQWLGTDIVTEMIDKQFWVKIVINRIIDMQGRSDSPDYVIITDGRLLHEVNAIRTLGVKLIHVRRDINNSEVDTHISENGIEPLPGEIIIENNGSLEDLKLKVLEVLKNV